MRELRSQCGIATQKRDPRPGKRLCGEEVADKREERLSKQIYLLFGKGKGMALLNFMVFLMLFLFGLICLLAVLGSDRDYDRDDDDEQQQFLMSWKRDKDEETKKR